MTMFTRRTLVTGRHRARRGRRAHRSGPARLGQGLGADRAMEAREGRAAVDAALEVFRAVGGRRLRGADRRLHQGDRRQGQRLARILRGRAAEGLGCRQYRRRAGPVLGSATRCRICSRRNASTSPTSPTISARSTAAGCRRAVTYGKSGNKWIAIPICYSGNMHELPHLVAEEGGLLQIPGDHRRIPRIRQGDEDATTRPAAWRSATPPATATAGCTGACGRTAATWSTRTTR